jgi:hypothetical protein
LAIDRADPEGSAIGLLFLKRSLIPEIASFLPDDLFFWLLVFTRHLVGMKPFLLSLATVASLTIAGQADDVSSPILGRDVTQGGVTTHYGAPIIVPDSTSEGKWIPFPVHATPDPSTFLEVFLDGSTNYFTAKLHALMLPATYLPNGVVVGMSKPTLNHDGQAYKGQFARRPEQTTDSPAQRDFEAAQIQYRKNNQSAKWHIFVNGE